ncbi:MAG TPA: hypothetical protein VMV48_06045 [Gallionellaceae bacterium]|nr:hypothetical protein [Gallionellaceae bacterium]
MAIKQQTAITQADFEAALVSQRLSVSEVSRESGIPRHIVSHFRNYGDGLKPEQAAKLRDYFESLGVEFTEAQDSASTQQSASGKLSEQPALKLPLILSDDGLTQRAVLACRHFFIDERLTVDQIKEAGERFEDGFNQAKELMGVELVSNWNSYDEATETKLRELWGHLARIGLVSLHLQGRILINQDRLLADPSPDGKKTVPKTLGDMLFNSYRDAVAGLSPYEQPEQTEEEEETTE